MNRIDRFTGDFAFLSNFSPSPIKFAPFTAATVEHAFQASKARTEPDRRFVLEASTPGQAKRRGRAVLIRHDWEQIRLSVMLDCVRRKFATWPDLREQLLSTGDDELIEGNDWGDAFWGCTQNGGENWLGRILMLVRSECAFLATASNDTHTV